VSKVQCYQSYQADSRMEPMLPSCHTRSYTCSLCGSEVPWRIKQGLNPQGQGQGLKICPGHLKAEDYDRGQQHC